MLEGFEKYTYDLTEEEYGMANTLADFFNRNPGLNYVAVDLARVAQMNNPLKQGPRVRKIMHYIRTAGLARCVVADSKGYHKTELMSEMESYVKSLDGRIAAISHIRAAMAEQMTGVKPDTQRWLFS